MKLSSPGAHNALKAASVLVGAGVGITTAINLAANKFGGPAGQGPFPDFTSRSAVLTSRVIGKPLALKIFAQAGLSPNTMANLPDQGVNPWGPLNSSTAAGVLLLVLDGVVHSFIGGKYGYSHVSPFIKAVGGGLIGGGVIGGIFDPEVQAGGPTLNPGSVNGTSSMAALTRSGSWGSQMQTSLGSDVTGGQ